MQRQTRSGLLGPTNMLSMWGCGMHLKELTCTRRNQTTSLITSEEALPAWLLALKTSSQYRNRSCMKGVIHSTANFTEEDDIMKWSIPNWHA